MAEGRGEGFFKGGPRAEGGEGLNMTRCPITATDTVVSPPLGASPLHYYGKQTIGTPCPELKAIRGASIIEATKERQLMVATSENPGAGFGNLSVCDLLFRSSPICPLFIYCRLARLVLVPKCV